MRRALAAALFLTALAVLPLAAATHDVPHRYYVVGRLTHPDGGPACGVVVEAFKVDGTAFGEAVTDHEGRYRILLHLHDASVAGETSDEGAALQVRVPPANLAQPTTALPGPSTDGWGESHVNFQVPGEIGGECVNPLTAAALYVGLPVTSVAALSLTYLKVVRPWWVRRSIAPTMTSLPGIGKAREKELRGIGIASLEDLAAAQPAEVARQTSIGKKEARRLIRRAREAVQTEES